MSCQLTVSWVIVLTVDQDPGLKILYILRLLVCSIWPIGGGGPTQVKGEIITWFG